MAAAPLLAFPERRILPGKVGTDPAWCGGGFQCAPGASACLALCT